MSQDQTTSRRAVDPAALVTAGATTLAWYAVPDVVGPRWARALAKTAVSAAGAVLTVRATAEGREAQEAVRSARAAVRVAADTSDGATADGPGTADATDDDAPSSARPAVLVLAGVGAVAVSTALAVAGEKWVHRRGERLRARGVRFPHTRVGLAMAVVAVALTAVEPYLRRTDEGETADGPAA
ncbi:hypothetical protein [Cellulosimicrobium cellulans]|uniref:hypothetical protein n=1 Tax=Cellulosimicrobium cellulans TaxID=1710 RepID=UPI000848C438|nr:hypothetical protein [Cellulosimicrobium cellulans]